MRLTADLTTRRRALQLAATAAAVFRPSASIAAPCRSLLAPCELPDGAPPGSGRALKLPAQYEPRRAEIEAVLPALV